MCNYHCKHKLNYIQHKVTFTSNNMIVSYKSIQHYWHVLYSFKYHYHKLLVTQLTVWMRKSHALVSPFTHKLHSYECSRCAFQTQNTHSLTKLMFLGVHSVIITEFVVCRPIRIHLQWESKILTPKVFWQYFPNHWEFLNKIVNIYCMFISMWNCHILFHYL